MITTIEAVLAALVSMQTSLAGPAVGSVSALLLDDRYRVVYVGVRAAGDRNPPVGLQVYVDAGTGRSGPAERVTGPEITALVPPVVQEDARGVLTVEQAQRAAADAIKGFEHYDKRGAFSILLKADCYEIRYPRLDALPGARQDEYAYLVRIEPRSGRVLKVMVPS